MSPGGSGWQRPPVVPGLYRAMGASKALALWPRGVPPVSPGAGAGTRAVCGRGSFESGKSKTRTNLAANSGGHNFARIFWILTVRRVSAPCALGGPGFLGTRYGIRWPPSVGEYPAWSSGNGPFADGGRRPGPCRTVSPYPGWEGCFPGPPLKCPRLIGISNLDGGVGPASRLRAWWPLPLRPAGRPFIRPFPGARPGPQRPVAPNPWLSEQESVPWEAPLPALSLCQPQGRCRTRTGTLSNASSTAEAPCGQMKWPASWNTICGTTRTSRPAQTRTGAGGTSAWTPLL